ncbi:general secretion pathway protein GspK [Zavarzinia compransoris]|uniref:general secretion pathway protein GspK n=1 Tax=Zavarzinia marina TaxID=2911065 RepID=UPI001F1868EC|nr:type II secretion system protein GspK [Zavarzinia marina]MCF4164781.1 general secretion pathway protein GspK [Zavarzinia marina]
MRRGGERGRGFALPAAIVGVAAFALVALAMVDWGRGVGALLQARVTAARLSAAADSGLALAIHGAALRDPRRRWARDGKPRALTFDGIAVTVVIEDERAFVPLNAISGPVLRALLAYVGAGGARLDGLAAALGDWIDADDETRPGGAERAAYAAAGLAPRNGPIREAGELAVLKGMDRALLDRLLPLISLVPRADQAMVDGRWAKPEIMAIMAIMAGAGPEDLEAMIRARKADPAPEADTPGEREPLDLVMIRITVEARLGPDAVARRRAVIEFTGDPARPYWVRSFR